jgi:citryl-CoA lyase
MTRPSPDQGTSAATGSGKGSTAARSSWRTAITQVEPDRILVRGYPVDEAMGRLSFSETVYLLLVGELPSAQIGRLVEALLVATIDHGATPPSTLTSRHVASTGAPLHASAAAGILGFGKYHGGDIATGMQFLEDGVALVHGGLTHEAAARQLVSHHRKINEPVPGFGHRLHRHDPRAMRLFQIAFELDLDGPHIQLIRAVERALNDGRDVEASPIPINVDGAIAAVCCDLGLSPEIGSALFIVGRVPGLLAHALEEQTRERRMRQIDSSRAVYDGPAERRLPDKMRR